ncbi:MAG: hypothetical protein ABSG75_14665 [Syntrophales bacterium]|jgi:hypothetical protein
MKKLSEQMKEEALKDLRIYFGKPPYDIEYIRRCYSSSGLFDQQALVKYGRTPFELIRELQAFYMTDKTREEALKDLKMYFGEPPVKEETIRSRLSSGLMEMQILAKYLFTVDELISKVGFAVIQ